MMIRRTPSPPRRVRTPPAPLHGDDSYQPFSPRRSSRVAAQQHFHHERTSLPHTRHARDVTPTSTKKRPAARSAAHALSPPSSPISPAKLRRSHRDSDAVESDSDAAAPTPARRLLSAMAPHALLPTPAKTPRKRALQSEDSLGSTARVLFSGRPATIEEAMPSPRKGRKGKIAYTLESFAEQMEDGNAKIEIYTDSKERIPTRDDEADNPFVSKRGKVKAKAVQQKPRSADTKPAEMLEASSRDEGMVYIFRGKKIFRKFTDTVSSGALDAGTLSSEDETRHFAGPEARRPLTRSAIKPRLLFQEEIQRLEQEDGNEDDEEAITDIEIPVATPSRRTQKAVVTASFAAQEATPPPTTRVKRQISFDSWSRVKSSTPRGSSSSFDGKKRGGSPLERSADKRARSTRSEHSSSAMSVDEF